MVWACPMPSDYWATCKQKILVMDGSEVALEYMDLINQYFYRSKYKPQLPSR